MTPAELALLLDHSVLKPEKTDRDILAGVEVVAHLKAPPSPTTGCCAPG